MEEGRPRPAAACRKEAAAIHARLGTRSLTSLLAPMAQWEYPLKALEELAFEARNEQARPGHPPAPAGVGDPRRRRPVVARPHEQHLYKNGTWSAGKPVSMKRLATSAATMEFLLHQDRAATAKIRQARDWSGRLRYAMDEAALFELAGHPHVVDEAARRWRSCEESPNSWSTGTKEDCARALFPTTGTPRITTCGETVQARRDLAVERAGAKRIVAACPALASVAAEPPWVLPDPAGALELLEQLHAADAPSTVLCVRMPATTRARSERWKSGRRTGRCFSPIISSISGSAVCGSPRRACHFLPDAAGLLPSHAGRVEHGRIASRRRPTCCPRPATSPVVLVVARTLRRRGDDAGGRYHCPSSPVGADSRVSFLSMLPTDGLS